jgi:pimeloyl-ACP methyl ester carboxylesterase
VISTHASLLRWLGPWSSATARPEGISRTEIAIAPREARDRPFEAWLYAPLGERPVGAFLLVPGLHYQGPADVRFDRFARILAVSGILVMTPFLPDFLALSVDPRVIGDLDRAFAALLEQELIPKRIKPGVFSVSFGSLPALRLAASDARRDQVGALVVFGGYADLGEALRFCLGARGDNLRRDPLNQPVAFMNLIDHLDGRPDDPARLIEAWRTFVVRTWGREEMKATDRWSPIARELEVTLPESERALFRLGCGLDPGAIPACLSALERMGDRLTFLDPRPWLDGLRCPVMLCHGVEDDVIPHTELDALAKAMPPGIETHAYRTGLYHHTGTTGRLLAVSREGITLVRLLRGLVRAASRPRTAP